MDQHGLRRCVPRRVDPAITPQPLLGLDSGYVRRGLARLPMQGSKWPFKLYHNYMLDLLAVKLGRIDDGTLELAAGAQAVVESEPARSAPVP